MADNTQLNSGTGGDLIASDDIGGVKYQRVKPTLGADGTAVDAVPVSAGLDTTGTAVQAVGLVAQFDDVTPSSVTENQFAPVRMSTRRALLVEGVASGTAVTVDGSAVTQPVSAASLPLPSGAATAANQSTIIGHVDGIEGLLTTMDADTGNIATNTSNLNNCIVQDDSPFTPATGYLMMVGGEHDDSAPDSVDEGDAGNFRISANRNLYVQVRDAAGNERGLNIDASGNANITGTVTLSAGTNTNEVVGDAAHDAAAAGNPVMVAGAAQDTDDTAPPNRVSAEGDTTRIATDRDGSVFVRPHGPQVWSYHLDTSTAQTDASVHAAPGVGLSLYVTDIVFSSGAATAINLFFEESTTKVLGPYYLEAVAGRGMHIRFGTPKKITANTALTLTTSASIAHCVDVTGFVAQG